MSLPVRLLAMALVATLAASCAAGGSNESMRQQSLQTLQQTSHLGNQN